MALVALILYFVFGVLGFGWRSWQQHRRTGSTGFRGISGRPGSLEWLAGVGFIAAIVVGVSAALLQLTGVLPPLDIVAAAAIQAAGIVLAIAGIGATVYAQNDMGESWRIGVDARETTTLVRGGVFGWVRNPIFTAMLVFAAGVALIIPNIMALAGFALLLATIELQVRIVEEPYLLRVHGHDYRNYTATTGRFLPGIGRHTTQR
ncbi:isoprenylcysteine carboxylmethyltransferase family protein [Nocardia vinacea]|uniref:Isoprenylcysteine carboxylmethyltransferase family protein n=1 Tax=Nocardia vinacea TaxID=96468 RepID=A0ABZ1YTT0_9NOCA|nr:isoprenylcysteine carboxylmethyltransferase family protein [Nocardia vinacea]